MKKYEFQAESGHLLELMIHSVYSEREIFLRELISNSSDAMDKLRYLYLTGAAASEKMEEPEIRIRIDRERRLLRISDRGIGMNEEELASNLGTIARSGSRSFREAMAAEESAGAGPGGEAGGSFPGKERTADLIGRFGVGFYSAFMVADRIAVISRKFGDTRGWRWDSDGVSGFTIRPWDRKTCGTDVILHIRPEETPEGDEFNQFLREYPLYRLVKKYSDYIRYPIKIYMPHPELKPGSTPEKPEFEEQFSYETVNSMVPLWQRSRSEVKREDQIAFYKEHFNETADPQRILTADVEGNVSYKALLYIPGKQPQDYGTDDFKPGLELYSNGVKVMDVCTGLLPEEWNFIRGVVDSPDISLNISREILQKNRRLTMISNNLTKKVRNELSRMLRQEREEYEKFHGNFGHHLKVCAMDEYGKKKDQLAEYLLFWSGLRKSWITLAEYVDHMKEGQKAIYYASGDTVEQIGNLPQIEVVYEQGIDVLYFLDKADQFVAQMFGNYAKKPFRSVLNGDLELPESGADESRGAVSPERGGTASGAASGGIDGSGDGAVFSGETDAAGTANHTGAADPERKPLTPAESEALLSFISTTLEGRIHEVKASRRLRSHPVCLSSGSGITFEMERYFRSLSPDVPVKAKHILEVNLDHEALRTLARVMYTDPERAKKYCEVLYHQARMIAGIPVEDPSAYTDLLCSLWTD